MKNRLQDRLTRLHSGNQQKAIFKLFKAIGLMIIIIVIALLVFAWLLEAGAQLLDYEDIRKPGDISQGICNDAISAVKTFKQPELQGIDEISGKFQKPQKIEVTKSSSGGTNIEDHPGASSPLPIGQSGIKVKGRLYFFLSFSVPSETIKQAVLDAVKLSNKDDLEIVLVLRGLVNNNFKFTFKTFYDFKQENGLFDTDFPVELDPEIFAKHSVSRVPHIIFESEDKTGSISGVGIRYALSKFSEEITDYGKQGDTYEILEEDFIRFLSERANSPAVQEKIKNAFKKSMENMYRLTRYDGKFNKALKDRVYRIDPTVTLSDDLIDHEGNVIFKKGSKFNPVDYVTMSGKYIVIDGTDDKQVRFAINGNYRKIILTSGDVLALTRKYKTAFYFINDILIERFQLAHVPAILEQEGRYLLVTEKAVD